jgi:hypothetical protein
MAEVRDRSQFCKSWFSSFSVDCVSSEDFYTTRCVIQRKRGLTDKVVLP